MSAVSYFLFNLFRLLSLFNNCLLILFPTLKSSSPLQTLDVNESPQTRLRPPVPPKPSPEKQVESRAARWQFRGEKKVKRKKKIKARGPFLRLQTVFKAPNKTKRVPKTYKRNRHLDSHTILLRTSKKWNPALYASLELYHFTKTDVLLPCVHTGGFICFCPNWLSYFNYRV